MADEPTPWELRRNVEDLRRTIEAGFAGLNSRLDRVVSNELFQAYQQAVRREFDDLAADMSTMRAEREAEKKQRAADRKMVVTAVMTSFVSPVVLLLVQLWLTSKGS